MLWHLESSSDGSSGAGEGSDTDEDYDQILQRELDDQPRLIKGGPSTSCSIMSMRRAIRFNMGRQPMLMRYGLSRLTFEMPIEIRNCTVDQCREMLDELIGCCERDTIGLHDWWVERREGWPNMTLAEKANLLSASHTPFLLYNIEGVRRPSLMTLLMQVLQVADVCNKRITSHQTNVTYQVDPNHLNVVKRVMPRFGFEQTPSTSVGFTSRLSHRAHIKLNERARTMQVFSHSLNYSMRYIYGVFPCLVGMRNELHYGRVDLTVIGIGRSAPPLPSSGLRLMMRRFESRLHECLSAPPMYISPIATLNHTIDGLEMIIYIKRIRITIAADGSLSISSRVQIVPACIWVSEAIPLLASTQARWSQECIHLRQMFLAMGIHRDI